MSIAISSSTYMCSWLIMDTFWSLIHIIINGKNNNKENFKIQSEYIGLRIEYNFVRWLRIW